MLIDHYSTPLVLDLKIGITEVIKMDLELLRVRILVSFKNKEHRTTEIAQTQMHKNSSNNIPLIAFSVWGFFSPFFFPLL